MNNTSIIPTDYIGQKLIQRPFRDWFLYMFKVIEGRKFIVEPLHGKLLAYFQGIIDGKITRTNVSIAPRSGKSTISQYFVVYMFTINPKSQSIYTSYSQSLLSEMANKVASIMEHPVYKAMYPQKHIMLEAEEIQPINDYWREYLNKDTKGQNKYSSKIIKTYAGGMCLFIAIGSSLTGFGAGIRNSKKLSGACIIDDANKPADINSKVLRQKTITYFEETLLSRLNNPNTPIINIQQRLHLEDLTGILEKKYNFTTFKVPLINDDGTCNLPSQYTEERIKELKVNDYMFQSQYQQSPIKRGGNLIKTDWFKYYDISVKYNYSKIIMALDSAISSKESADRSVFLAGGITGNNQLHILDMNASRSEYPQLKQICIDMYNKYQFDKHTTSMSAIYIENKASGQQLVQDLKGKGLPIIPVEATKDKVTRVMEILEYIQSGQVFLPSSEMYGFNPEFLAECGEFNMDMSQVHDDVVDSLCHLINNTIAHRKVNIFDVL